MSNDTVTNERPYYRIEWTLGLLAAGLSMVMIAWAAKDTWFFADVWDHLANRSLGSINDILRPRGAHWVTPTVVLMRSTYALVGLDYWPWHYILRVLVWAGMAIVIWRVLLVRGTDRLVAMAALLILLFLGPSSWVVSAFLGNPLALGAAVVAAAIAASRPVAIRRARILLFAALLLALISSGEGVALLVAIGIAIVVAARFKDWWPSLVGAAGIYGVWFIYYSRNGDMGTSQAGGAISHQLPVKIAETLAANLPGILGLTADFGPALLVALVVLVSALAVQRKLGIYEGTLLGTMVLYVALIYVGRVGTGLAIPNADRYMSTIGVLLIAALVPHIGRITTRQRRATFVAISLAILVTQGPILLRGINFWEAWSSASRDVVESAGAIVVDGEPYLDNALVDPPKSGVLRFRDLAGFIDDGWDPRLSDDANAVELARARSRTTLGVGGTVSGRRPNTASRVSAEGCAVVAPGGDLVLTVDGGSVVAINGPKNTMFSMKWVDEYGVGRVDYELVRGSHRLSLVKPVTVAEVTLTSTDIGFDVCGIVPTD